MPAHPIHEGHRRITPIIPISTNALARAFDSVRSHFKAAIAHGLDPPGHCGNQSGVNGHRERQILDWIRETAEQDMQVTKGEIKDYCTP
jgi:hypothetical protein